jgi:hypothetical protein
MRTEEDHSTTEGPLMVDATATTERAEAEAETETAAEGTLVEMTTAIGGRLQDRPTCRSSWLAG